MGEFLKLPRLLNTQKLGTWITNARREDGPAIISRYVEYSNTNACWAGRFFFVGPPEASSTVTVEQMELLDLVGIYYVTADGGFNTMANTSKIVLEQHGHLTSPVPAGKLRYTVVSLTNRTRPMVGEELTEGEVNKLKAETVGLTVEIKGKKR